MKLIIKEYLASLRERGELDAILPDLLSQMGLNVYSRPGRGTRQDGVDVGAVGSIDGGPEKVYLFTIKAGDLSRATWDGNPQCVRPSLNEIIDSYIPTRLPQEHRDKDIVICICCGGDVLEPVRTALEGFIAKNTQGRVSFEEWNGDKLAARIQSSLLREELLPPDARSRLRKSLALLDEPATSYLHFAELVRALCAVDQASDAERITAIRQASLCLWILFAWTRQARNMESAYLSGEIVLLHAWSINRLYVGRKDKMAQAIHSGFISIFSTYQQICTEFLKQNVLPHVGKLHGISTAICGSTGLDVNLKLFDLVGRLALDGIWAYWGWQRCTDEQKLEKETACSEAAMYATAVKGLVANNPALLLPIKDDQAIDLSIAFSLLGVDSANRDDMRNWLSAVVERAGFAYILHGQYPCTLDSYSDLLSHPVAGDPAYRESATSGSILYPLLALWAGLLGDAELYEGIALLKREHLRHCNFQLWYPDECSEEHFYKDSDRHGAMLCDVAVERPMDELLAQVFGECGQTPHFNELSAVKAGWWPLIVVACRHYRVPVPLHLLEGLRPPTGSVAVEGAG
jgi:hypothetical protein